MKTRLALILSVLTSTGLLVGQDSRSVQVDQLFARWNGSDTPGAAVAVARGDEVLHIGTYGERDVGTGESITRDTAFYIASTSKQFTAACIAHLAQSGELSLDDDVRKYVPELPDYGDTITVRHLLTHRSGLRDFLELMIFAGWDMDAEHDEQRALQLICRQKDLNFRRSLEACPDIGALSENREAFAHNSFASMQAIVYSPRFARGHRNVAFEAEHPLVLRHVATPGSRLRSREKERLTDGFVLGGRQ